MKRLAVAHMVSGKAAAVINALRQRHDPRTAAAIGAHISLAGPCDTPAPLDDLEAMLSRIAASARPFELTIAGVATFLPVSSVCYLEVQPSEPLVGLHDLLVANLHWEEAFPYVPHVTVTEYLPPADTEAVALQLRALAICERDRLDTITLLEKAPDGRWAPLRTFAFRIS
jgi:2'-5' RNA ligase